MKFKKLSRKIVYFEIHRFIRTQLTNRAQHFLQITKPRNWTVLRIKKCNISFNKRNVFQGLEQLEHLEEFSMKHDCCPVILETLTRRCKTTLVKLDVECSKHVDDSCLPYILRCQNLYELAVFKTGEKINISAVMLLNSDCLLYFYNFLVHFCSDWYY
jgi:hypothetical protein